MGWVVGVDGVGGVGGDAGGALVGAFGFVEVEAEGIGGAFEGVLEDGAGGAGGGSGADFFVVEAGEDEDVGGGVGGVDECGDGWVDGAEVVESAGGEEFVVSAEAAGWLGVDGDEVVGAGVSGEDAGWVGGGAVDGGGVVLSVECGVAVEVDGEVGDAEQWWGFVEVGGAVSVGDDAGEFEVAVEPGGDDGAAVDFDCGLVEAVGGVVGGVFEFESG